MEGIVLDERGAPIPNAQVRLIPVTRGHVFGSRVVQVYQTSKAGRFSINNVAWGEYRVFAGKQDQGYPTLPMPFYGIDAFPMIHVGPASTAAEVSVTLGTKAGAIQSISARDAETGEDVAGVVTLRRIADPKAYIRVSTTLRPVLLPSKTDLSVEVAAAGYTPWPTSKSASAQGRLRLKPEEGVNLEVRLAPEGSEAVSVGSFSPAPYSPGPNVALPAAVEADPILLKEVKEFKVTGDGVFAPVEQLAGRYNVPIGLELLRPSSASTSARPVSVEVEIGTVRDVLDAIVEAYPDYEWERSDFGTIGVYPKNRTPSLRDVVVGRYAVQSVNRDTAFEKLMETPEVRGWLASAGVERRGFGGPLPSEGAKRPGNTTSLFSISLSHASVRTVLNAILIASGSRYWMLYHYGEPKEFILLTMGD